MSNRKVALGLAAALMAGAQLAHAGFSIEQADAPAGSPALIGGVVSGVGAEGASSAGVTQLGAPKGEPAAAKGFGKEVSLLTALKQVVPEGWRAKRSGSLDLDRKVSWRGDGRSWVAVLDTLAKDAGFAAVVDWERKAITVSAAGSLGEAAPAKPAAKPMILESAASASAPAGAVRDLASAKAAVAAAKAGPNAALAQVASAAPIPQMKTWTLSTDKTLRENIDAWAKRAGWSLSWEAADYPVSVPVTLQGELDAEDGPLAQLAAAYEGAEQPLSFRALSGNKTVRVENRRFRQEAQADALPAHRNNRPVGNTP